MKKTFLRAVGVFTAALMLCLSALPAYAADKVYYDVVPHSFIVGDKIYYDNSETGWEKVRIYMWSGVSVMYVGQDPYDWVDRPEMTRIGDTDIWVYEVPTIEPFCADLARSGSMGSAEECVSHYSMPYYDRTTYDTMWGDVRQLLFTDGADETNNKTSDLDYINNGLVYKSTKRDGSQGEWYLYEGRKQLTEKLNAAKAYADKIVCIEEDEAQGFVEVISEAMNRIGENTLVYSDQDGYYSYDVASIIASIADVTESVKEKYGENPTVCEEDATDNESDNPDTFDSISLFVGLGAASFAGLAIGLNQKRRA